MFRSPAVRIAAIVVVVLAALVFLRVHTRSGGTAQTHIGPNTTAARSLTIGYLPVTCHLTCPVTDYASKHTQSNTNFDSRRFTDFPTMTDAMRTGNLQATFMIVPLAMQLRAEGVPVKICYLGHRDGSAVIVAKNDPAKSLRDEKGKTFAIPSIYSNQNLVIHEAMQAQGMQPNDIKFVPMAPPDMPTALAAHAIAGYFVGEPFPAKAVMDGTGRFLYQSQDLDPNFISCALVVRDDLIQQHPNEVRDLVHGIASSGAWAQTHRAQAATLVAPYFRQDPKLLNYVLTTPGLVNYVGLTPTDAEMQKIENTALQMGVLKKAVPVSQLLDLDFIPKKITPAKITLSKA